MVDSEELFSSENEENEDEDEDEEDQDEYVEYEDEAVENEDEAVENEEEQRTPAALMLNNLSSMINNASLRSPESSLNEADEASRGRAPNTFDKTLPAKHEYLGIDFEEVRGRTLLDENAIVRLPVLMELGIVLVPGQTLPLTELYPPNISMFRKIIAEDKTFGVISVNGLSQYGTTAEIFQYHEDGDFRLIIKAKGRQRFKLLEDKCYIPGISSRKVLILPEISLSNPLRWAKFESLNRYRNNSSLSRKLSCIDAVPTSWPSWVYKQYDPAVLFDKVIGKLKNLEADLSTAVLPNNPVDLSFWIVQCLPVDGKHRNKMITFNTCIERLQYALNLLSKGQQLYCSRCGNYVADKKDIFSMSVDGPQCMYCNPGGYVHDIVTVYNVTGINLLNDRPSLEHSWFPGYGWTIAQCSNCECHMGWLFTATKKNLKPMVFWGLSRKSLSTQRKINPRLSQV